LGESSKLGVRYSMDSWFTFVADIMSV
jgi:hypothetical protein